MSSWIRVAQGIQKVAGAASQKIWQDTSVDAARIVQHAVELSSRVMVSRPSQSYDSSSSSLYQTSFNEIIRSEEMARTFDSPNDARGSTDSSSTPETQPRHQPEIVTEVSPTDSESSPLTKGSEAFAMVRTGRESETEGGKHHHQPSPESAIQHSPTPQNVGSLKGATVHSVSQSNNEKMTEGAPVPSTRWGRALGFANLGIGLAYGAVGEGARRLVFPTPPANPQDTSSNNSYSSVVMTDANADRLAATLCRMRGAALKLGQMLSIQDASLLPPPLTRALAQVRQGAAAMPAAQLHDQLVSQYGSSNWRSKMFVSFDPIPCAAASIGQVHRAVLRTGDTKEQHEVVVKVQYPGVAESISSDLRNLGMLVKWSGVMPKGLFIENVMRVGEQELRVECDYVRERKNQQRMQELVHGDEVLFDQYGFRVPDVYEDWCTDQVLVTGFASGGTVDRIADTASQEERNRLGRGIIDLTMKELFTWRFMQTDPNWGNFLYDVGTRTTSLIDFGATREFSKSFVDGYLRIVWASANRDEDTLLAQSRTMKFLTGQENQQMIRAHTLSGFTVGEPFASDEPFDFRGSRISERMGEHTSVFLKHRLTPPPEEVYTLHRKLAGAYMLCIKLGSVFSARDLLANLVQDHSFEDGLPHPMER